METAILLIGAVGGILAIPVGYFTAKMTASSQKESTEIETRGPDWDRFMERVEKHNAETRAQLNGRIDRLQNKVQRLEDKLAEKDKLIEEKDALIELKERRYQVAITRLARFAEKYPNDPLSKSIPHEIRDDMPAYRPRDEPEV